MSHCKKISLLISRKQKASAQKNIQNYQIMFHACYCKHTEMGYLFFIENKALTRQRPLL